MVLLECVKQSTSKTYTEVHFSNTNGRLTKNQRKGFKNITGSCRSFSKSGRTVLAKDKASG